MSAHGRRDVVVIAACIAALVVSAGDVPATAQDESPDDAGPPLTISWARNYLTIRGEHLLGEEVRILYIEAYCRANSQTTDWGKHTVIGHRTELLSASEDGTRIELRCTLRDGVTVDHVITAGADEIDFRLTARNPTIRRSEAHWAQPCIRVGAFTGLGDPANPQTYEYITKSFVFLDGELSRMPTRDWATEARYTPGQVWAAPGVPRADVNPRPLSSHVPSNGLIGCFGDGDRMILATAWEPWQELFQGVITCLHSDFRLGGLRPGETREIRGKIYLVANDVDALLDRYHRDFPEHHARSRALALERSARRRAFGGIEPRVSPDGSTIALSFQGAVCRVPSGGGALTRLTRGEGWDVSPAWSPAGDRIAFVRTRDLGDGDLLVVDAATGAPVALPAAIRARGPLFFHPDGHRLLGRLASPGGGARIAWCDLDDGAVTPVEGIPDSHATRRAPFALSADGRWIAWAEHADRPGEQSGNNGPAAELWRVPGDGGAPSRVTVFPARIYRIDWSGDPRSMRLVSDFGVAHNDIWELPLQPRGPARKLTSGQADEDWPTTTRDGAATYHTANDDGATAIVRRDRSSGRSSPIEIDGVDFREPTGRVLLEAVDRDSGELVVARVSVRREGGKFHAPVGALYRLTRGLGHFTLRHRESLELPAGDYEVIAFRGPEYRVAQSRVTVHAGRYDAHTIVLERWVDAAQLGLHSGENHIHANYGYGAWYSTPQSVLDQCEAEDLDVANLMVANSDGDGVFDREFFRGAPDPLSTPETILYWNEEFRSTIWGHLTLVNLDRLVEPIFTGFAGTTNPHDVPTNADIADRARVQDGVSSYTHPASNAGDPYASAYSAKGLPVDAALGHVDTIDVMGFGYGASLGLWYRLLDCGFRLPAASGTDCFLNRIHSWPPGWGRTYVRLPGGLDYGAWIEGQRAGRSFVTTGPMLELTAGGREPGDTIELTAPGELRVTGRAWSAHPLDRLEVISNGEVVATGAPKEERIEWRLDTTIRCDTSGWLALRTEGPASRHHGAPRLVAHTSPIFIEITGHPRDTRETAEYFLKWIDRLETDLRARDRIPTALGHVEEQLERAREIYRRLANRR